MKRTSYIVTKLENDQDIFDVQSDMVQALVNGEIDEDEEVEVV
jgi:hypothetical protein